MKLNEFLSLSLETQFGEKILVFQAKIIFNLISRF